MPVRRTRCRPPIVLIAGLCVVASAATASPPAKTPDDIAKRLPPPAQREIDFMKDVQPIFRQRCFECHAKGNEKGGLNLGLRARVMEGGENGPVLFAGKSVASSLIHRVAALDKDTVMPPEGKPLTNEQIGLLRAWIDQGAKWPAGADVLDPRVERGRKHWAFQPLKTVPPPTVKNTGWTRTPIDRFILAALEARQLQPTPPATPQQLIRRIAYDVSGLPPSPEDVAKFAAAYRRDPQAALKSLIDGQLQSRQYGERWGRHWLDVARYADSNGQEADQDRPEAYRYRDFVIRSLNEDLPFNTFVRWQIAGDEYAPENANAVIATGFLVAGPHTVLPDTFLEEERLRNRYNELDDMLSTLGTGMLGLTLGCARCHDHKYDAVSAREYYRLLSAFHNGDRKQVKLKSLGKNALVFRDFSARRKTTWLFKRADFYDRKQEVQLGFLNVLSSGKRAEAYWNEAKKKQPLADSSYQRQALAEWMTDEKHGAGALLARVIVNRIWQHHFGEGIVRSVNDFGVRGDSPTHPELLEWLAADFVQHGWKLKRLHRLILMSAVYQQGHQFHRTNAKADPENRLLWRKKPQRLEAEIIRDAMLAVSGSLNRTSYGPAFKPQISPEAMIARNLKSPYPKNVKETPDTLRRSVYLFHKRVVPYPLLQAFDKPDSLQGCGRREQTTVAPQALAMLNDDFVRTRSFEFADRLLKDMPDADHGRLIERAFLLAIGRAPSLNEQTASKSFLASQIKRRQARDAKTSPAAARRLAVADFCQAVFGLNEFIYVD